MRTSDPGGPELLSGNLLDLQRQVGNAAVGRPVTAREGDPGDPESSVYGHKVDKIGEGSLATNQRLVELSEFGSGGDWTGFLADLGRYWGEMKKAADGDRDEARRLRERLVGPRTGAFAPPAG